MPEGMFEGPNINPMLNKGLNKCEISFLQRKWNGDDGKIKQCTVKLTIDVLLDRSLYFILQDDMVARMSGLELMEKGFIVKMNQQYDSKLYEIEGVQ